MSHTLSRISIRFSASTGLRGGEPLGDCSARNAAETTKGINCASTPNFVSSSKKVGVKSGGGLSSSVDYISDSGGRGLTQRGLSSIV